MKKIETIDIPFDTLTCTICGALAKKLVTIPWGMGKVNLCLCQGCAGKSAYQILEEAIKNE